MTRGHAAGLLGFDQIPDRVDGFKGARSLIALGFGLVAVVVVVPVFILNGQFIISKVGNALASDAMIQSPL
jgi:hypothetical protein